MIFLVGLDEPSLFWLHEVIQLLISMCVLSDLIIGKVFVPYKGKKLFLMAWWNWISTWHYYEPYICSTVTFSEVWVGNQIFTAFRQDFFLWVKLFSMLPFLRGQNRLEEVKAILLRRAKKILYSCFFISWRVSEPFSSYSWRVHIHKAVSTGKSPMCSRVGFNSRSVETGMQSKKEGHCGLVVRSWCCSCFQVCVSLLLKTIIV